MNEMSDRYVLHEPLPALNAPTLVVMLTGWIDASAAAAAAFAVVEAGCSSRPLATFDGDRYIDYRARRPTMELRDGVNTRLAWSDIELKVGRDAGGRDVLTLGGPEPDSQWRSFIGAVSDLAAQLGVGKMVGLGAFPFSTPHTRPSRLSSSTPSADVSAGLPYLKSSVDVPAGMNAALEHGLDERGIPALTLWVQVPHYVSSMTYPAATLALLTGLREVSGISVESGELGGNMVVQRERLDQLVSANPDHVGMVRQLEDVYDSSAEASLGLGSASIPSGDELAAELERYLREQGG